ncbi:MAG: hypothetical protein KGZ74_11320 [Chitinophagaceae bacterium]|nr:hypothetical protein [Chitinophagaceae bacterium]
MYNKSIFKLRNLLALLAIVSISFVACNNEGETKEPAADTTTPAPAPAVDTTKTDTGAIDTATVKPVPTPNK